MIVPKYETLKEKYNQEKNIRSNADVPAFSIFFLKLTPFLTFLLKIQKFKTHLLLEITRIIFPCF